MSDSYCQEFDCVECGRHIIRIIGEPYAPALCAACIMVPGWFRDPHLRNAIDADVNPPEHEREPTAQ